MKQPHPIDLLNRYKETKELFIPYSKKPSKISHRDTSEWQLEENVL